MIRICPRIILAALALVRGTRGIHGLAGLRGAGSARWTRLVFRRALGLHLLGLKAAVSSEIPFHESLCAVLESVRQGVASNVADRQGLILFLEHEVHATVTVRDRSRAYIPQNAHALVQRGSLKCRQFRNRVVVGLALREPYIGQQTQRSHNDARPDQKLGSCLHTPTPVRSNLRSKQILAQSKPGNRGLVRTIRFDALSHWPMYLHLYHAVYGGCKPLTTTFGFEVRTALRRKAKWPVAV